MISNEIVNYFYNKKYNFKISSLLNIVERRIDKYLVEENLVSEKELNGFWINYLGLPNEVDNINNINSSVIKKINLNWINHNKVIPYDEINNKVKVFICNITDLIAIQNLEKLLNKKAEIHLKTEEELSQMLDLLNANLMINEKADNTKTNKLLNSILSYALENNASDIHFEIQKDDVGVRFRIDGVLNENFRISSKSYLLLLNKVKILSNMDLTITLTPQDGHFVYNKNGKANDIRVSTIPTLYGSRLVLRVFYNENINFNLDHLGFDEKQLNDIKTCLNKSGLLLVTGPTGSGKTTTLYSILNYLKNERKNIMTIEDPIENDIRDIAQIPLNTMDYNTILKSIVRQDPDVIMVGEIRDVDTAANSIRLAQTGHLVLATIHSGDAISVINKLVNMGIPKYLLNDSLKLIVSQRLIRKPCNNCKFEYTPSSSLLNKYNLPSDCKLLSTTGCQSCLNTGYKGRIMIGEVVKIDEKNKELLFQRNYRKNFITENKKLLLDYQIIKKLKDQKVTYDEIVRNGIID